jgi:hypothetical protein
VRARRFVLAAIQSSQSGAYAQTTPHSKKLLARFLVGQHDFRTPPRVDLQIFGA